VLQWVAVCCSGLQCVALQFVAVCCSVLQFALKEMKRISDLPDTVYCSALQSVAECRVLQSDVECCSSL